MSTRVYRPAPWLTWFGLTFTCIYASVLAINLVWLALTDPTPRGPWFAVLFAALVLAVWGSMTLLSVYVLAAGLTARVVVNGLELTFIGPVRKKTIHLRDVTRVRWRLNDSVVLYAGRRRQSEWFASFHANDAADLVKLIRQNIPAGNQQGWHPYYEARMHGRVDGELRFRMIHPRAKRPPAPLDQARAIQVAFATGLIGALLCGVIVEWQFSALDVSPPTLLGKNPLLDWLVIGLLAPLPLEALLALSLYSERRRMRRAHSAMCGRCD